MRRAVAGFSIFLRPRRTMFFLSSYALHHCCEQYSLTNWLV
jgi:hypothetical protein